MFKHILVPTDGGPLSRKAAAAAIKFATAQGAKITAIYVSPTFRIVAYDGYVPPELISPESHKAAMAKLATRNLSSIEKLCKKAGIACEGVHVSDDQPYAAIIAQAKRRGCDLILMASHGRRGMAGVLLGSETRKVLTHSKIPVLVYR
jgi:nucleotide-binding universal stress UspA family protein